MSKTIKYFISFYKPYRKTFYMDMFCAVIISLIDISYPLIFSFCIQDFFLNDASLILQYLGWITLGMVFLYLIKAACRYYVSAQGHILGAQMERDMRQDLFEKFQKLSFSYYDEHNTGAMMSRVVSDLFDIAELAHHGPENLFISLIKIIGSFAIMACMNWQLALALFAVTVIMLVFSAFQNEKMESTFADNRKKISLINSALQDSLSGIHVVQSFANEDLEIEKFRTANNRYLQSKKENYHAMGAYYSGNHFFQGMLYAVIIGAGGLLVAYGKLEASSLAAFALYVNVFVSPLEILIEFTEMFQKGFSGFVRFEEVMKEIPEIQDCDNPVVLSNPKGEISFHDVDFAYRDGEPVLKDINFTIPAGRNVALVGPSGGGKTTICSLIPRFYDVTSGSITLDGEDIRNISLQSLRQNIGIVQQDVYLFDGTIADNIRYGRPDASDEEVLEAARKANILDLIESLPEGIYTEVGERGTRLSGGQKQRISIARIFLKNPKILILDEATSALDNESERIVQQSLCDLSRGRTCLTIAHRLSTIRSADEILVIDQEGIAERGRHEDLLKQNGIYAEYYRLQFRDQEKSN